MRVAPFSESYRVRVAPFSESYRVRVAPFSESYRVRVAPFTESYTYQPPCKAHQTPWGTYWDCPSAETRTRSVYNYENRSRAVYNYETRTRSVYNYENRSRAVYNYETRTRSVYNYENRSRAVYNYETRTRSVYNYENRSRAVSHTHSCASGQHLHGHDDCHADHSCASGYRLTGHDTCVRIQPPQCTPGPGEHKHTLFNNQVTCHAGDHSCPTGEHATSASTHGHVSGCHSATDPAHSCPGNQVAGSTSAHGHVSGCKTVVPAQCTPGPGEHKHTLFNNQVTCHAGDHSCPTGEHATSASTHGHVSGCHSATDPAHSCPGNQVAGSTSAHGHVSGCKTVVPAQCTPGPGEHKHTLFNNQVTCHAGDHSCPTGEHATSASTHGHVSGCHSATDPAHSCPGNQVAGSTSAHGHVSGCKTVVPAQCTPGPGEHKHTLFNNQVACHADHSCASGQHLHGHDDCHADHECKPTETKYDHDKCRPNVELRPDCQILTEQDSRTKHKHNFPTGGSYCHLNHECAEGLQLHGHDQCIDPVTCAEWSCEGTRDCAKWFGRPQHQHYEEKGGQWQWGECHDSESDAQQGWCTFSIQEQPGDYCFDIKRALLDDLPEHLLAAVCSAEGNEVVGWLTGRGARKWVSKRIANGGSKVLRWIRVSDDSAEEIASHAEAIASGIGSFGTGTACYYLTASDTELEAICLAYDHAATGCDGEIAIVFVSLPQDTDDDSDTDDVDGSG